jgi:hypothetical protein
MQKVSLSVEDRKYLVNLLQKKKDSLFEMPLVAIPLTFIMVMIPGKRSPSYFSQYGFFAPAGIIFFIILVFYYWDYYFSVKNLKKDIDSNEKIVEVCQITDKDINLKDECFIKINTATNLFKRQKVEKEVFDKIKNGDTVTVEFTEYSKFLFRIIFENFSICPLNKE